MYSHALYFLNLELDRLDKQKELIKKKMRKEPENKFYQTIYELLLAVENEKEKKFRENRFMVFE